MTSLDESEKLAARGATAPRVTLESMKRKVQHVHYFTAGQAIRQGRPRETEEPLPASLDILTICILTMQNGFILIGKSAPASPENFDVSKGMHFAYEDCIRQLWPLEGYLLRENLADEASLKRHLDCTSGQFRDSGPVVEGEAKITGGDKSEQPMPFDVKDVRSHSVAGLTYDPTYDVYRDRAGSRYDRHGNPLDISDSLDLGNQQKP